MDKISIIVPVYNAAPYLETCISSILNQSYSNLELILVNDGSTDDSAKICASFAQKDRRVKLITKANGGQSSARNLGLDVATGDLIMFVDSDDWLLDGCIERLYKALKDNDSDISIGQFMEFYEDTGKYFLHVFKENYYVKNYRPLDWFKLEYSNDYAISQVFPSPCYRLFKTDVWQGIRFPEGKIAEDELTIWKVYLLADKITFMNDTVYAYRKHSGSTTHVNSLAQILLYRSIEERIGLLGQLSADCSTEINAYKWRLGLHRDNDLKEGHIQEYYDVKTKIDIMRKYGKVQ